MNEDSKESISINEKIGTDLKFKHKIVWFNVFGFTLFHIIGLIGLYGWLTGINDIRTTIFGLFLGYASSFGITMGAHRLWCHRAYKAKRWLKFILLVCQTLAGQVGHTKKNCISRYFNLPAHLNRIACILGYEIIDNIINTLIQMLIPIMLPEVSSFLILAG